MCSTFKQRLPLLLHDMLPVGLPALLGGIIIMLAAAAAAKEGLWG